MKGEFTLKVLEFLEYGATAAGELLEAFLTDYHTSYRRLRGIPEFRRKEKRRYDPRIESAEIKRAAMQSFYDLITRLKRDGLIKSPKPKFLEITKKGSDKKKALLLRIKNSLPADSYNPKESNEWKIIIFDIPESKKRKRVWLRAVLKRLGFRMLQKSVWIGKNLLPEQFISDLTKLGLIPHVEILVITKKGSLRQL